jgi:HSP20 family protein
MIEGFKTKNETKVKKKGKKMRLARYQRPGLENGFEDPLQTLQTEINRLFDTPWWTESVQGFHGGWTPAVDLYEDRDSFTVKVELPGMKREDIEVSVHDGSVTISGERKYESNEEQSEASRSERYFGRFQRTLALAKPVEVNKASAAYKDGILTLTLPKAEEAKPKRIQVNVS